MTSYRVIYTTYKASGMARKFISELAKENRREIERYIRYDDYLCVHPAYKKANDFFAVMDVCLRSRTGEPYEEILKTFNLAQDLFSEREFIDCLDKLGGLELVCELILADPKMDWEEEHGTSEQREVY